MQYWDKYDSTQSVPLGLPELEMRISDPVLAAAIFQFLPRFRDVLYLAYFMQYSDKEISELLKIPVSTVTTRRRSTEEKLREILGEYHAV